MSLVSSAQNNEDVMLWRALKGVHEGFYIDVGAADPVDLSVTKLFYDHGWRGINIEPDPDFSTWLRLRRPRDVNLDVAAGAEPGELTFHHVPGTGLSTLDPTLAEQYQADGRTVRPLRARLRTLADICAEHRPEGDIHFLKIDVEGAEADVLRGADFERFRPWIVLVEATRPLSPEANHDQWESLLLQRGYAFAWFDGLNRFYLAEEHAAALGRHFQVQPNVFDGFTQAAAAPDQALRDHALNEAAARQRAEQSLAALQSAVATIQEFSGNEQAARLTAETAFRAEAQRRRREAEQRDAAEQRASDAERARSRSEQAAHQLTERCQALERNAGHLASRIAQFIAEPNAAAAVGTELAAHERRVRATSPGDGPDQGAIQRAEMHFLWANRLIADLLGSSAGRAAAAEAWNDRFRASTSWRLTRPFRAGLHLVRGRLSLRDAARIVRRTLSNTP